MSRVLIVDDHPGFRAAARAVLENDGYTVIAEAGDGRSGIDAAAELRPDVVLLDVQLPDVDGFDVCERIVAGEHQATVILVSGRPFAAFRRRLATSSARGFIGKADLLPGALGALLAAE
jgi:DNA-binding NarL/FixJ family response regulator